MYIIYKLVKGLIINFKMLFFSLFLFVISYTSTRRLLLHRICHEWHLQNDVFPLSVNAHAHTWYIYLYIYIRIYADVSFFSETNPSSPPYTVDPSPSALRRANFNVMKSVIVGDVIIYAYIKQLYKVLIKPRYTFRFWKSLLYTIGSYIYVFFFINTYLIFVKLYISMACATNDCIFYYNSSDSNLYFYTNLKK